MVMTTDQRLRMGFADGLCGWANCKCGAKTPENFGKGMAFISKTIGQPATPDNLMKLAEKLKNKNSKKLKSNDRKSNSDKSSNL